MKDVLLLLSFFLPLVLSAQITQSAIGNMGGEIRNDEISLIHAIGDVAGNSIGQDPELTQGFVQLFACDDCGKETVGIEDTYLNPQIQLYPNPTQGQFRLEGPAKLLHRYELWTLQGQLLVAQHIQDKTIDQTELSAGIYLIRTYGQDNRLTAILKLYKY